MLCSLRELELVRIMCRTMTSHNRILSVLKNGPARRNLFGPVDREQLQVEYQTALRKDLEEASQRWGFDFILDKPLASSDYQWEGIPGATVPLLYRSCVLDAAGGQRKENATLKEGRVEPPQSDKENIPHTPERCARHLRSLEKTPERGENTGVKRKQTNITDFYQAKRRVVWMPRKSGE
ncbi:cyclin-dependent kinase inhibitor 1 isoform X1 [Anabas testudineus]|uniref:Cyclin-dependent kinase inhibitor domain-containing protein n=1 Tax=Anabas testudineus TaxID=64144 RepID=A0A7N6AKR1_ANATE|nr:cyclin-dependent kinase inhibitor 1 isoform X1 [Anabas testudineus]